MSKPSRRPAREELTALAIAVASSSPGLLSAGIWFGLRLFVGFPAPLPSTLLSACAPALGRALT